MKRNEEKDPNNPFWTKKIGFGLSKTLISNEYNQTRIAQRYLPINGANEARFLKAKTNYMRVPFNSRGKNGTNPTDRDCQYQKMPFESISWIFHCDSFNRLRCPPKLAIKMADWGQMRCQQWLKTSTRIWAKMTRGRPAGDRRPIRFSVIGTLRISTAY